MIIAFYFLCRKKWNVNGLNHITKTISMNPFLGNVNIQKNHSRIKQIMFYKIHILTHGLTGKDR
ncbi:uncharacterized protein METZ01_LOCUS514977 [marine metagenome]|uniref:Uncharacterized protein n=1 Tax=marine metagenome TaxID=408172 RepID=A0A383F0C6_9ZZZZ